MPHPEDPVAARLESDRKALLDLSLRNPLLNYRPRVRGLEVVGESPEQVVKCLVRDGRRMIFLPAPEPPDPDAEPSVPPPSTDRADHKLQTALDADALRARLLAIHRAARTSIEEQGVNTLFLALGMLRWIEPGRDGGPLRAPLVLVPIELERSNARERFRLLHSGADLETNLSLAAKLKTDFKIDLPELPESTEQDVGRYLDGVASAVAEQSGWALDREAIALGFFSFGKFLMYRDLDPEVWPERARAENHPVVSALLRDGFPASASTIAEDDEAAALDGAAPPERAGHVLDADATQSLALLDVTGGKNLVIQGPPGTGKSQTITNLIASAIARGQTVLFVAEKLAALDVVKRRLDATGLGDACLELHSHKTSKRAVLDELQRTLRLGRPRLGAADDEAALLAGTRDRLNGLASAVHQTVGASGVSPFDAVGVILETGPSGDEADAALDLPAWSSWPPLERKRRLALVAEVQASLASLGVPEAHPFWGTRKATWLPDDSARLRSRLNAATEATARLISASTALAEFLRVAPPTDRAGCLRLLLAARRAVKAGHFASAGVDVPNPDWLARRAEIGEVIHAVKTLDETHQAFDAHVLPEAWAADLVDARGVLNVEGRHWWRWFKPSFRAAARRVDRLCRDEPPATVAERIALADAVMGAHRFRAIVTAHEPLAARLFGGRWQGERSSWESLALLAKWAAKLHHDVRNRRLPAGFLAFLEARPSLAPLGGLANELKAALGRHHDAVSALTTLLEFTPANGAKPPRDRPFAEQSALWQSWTAQSGFLPGLSAFLRLAERCRADGLAAVAAVAERWPGAAKGLVAAVERAGASSVLREAFRDRPALSGFDPSGHERAIQAFADLDRQALRHNRARAALAHWERLPRTGGGGQMGIMRREFEKKARHLPVRQLLARAGNAARAIKPVFLMSPLSVASYLTPGVLEFDLVVFDEASQVKPVDALGAILRAKQAVVVGDSRQLPPTSFFDRLTSGDDFDPDEDTGEAASDVESILGLFVASGAPERMLRWHYRSRHESLIAVSNRAFYDGRLVVFPSPDAARTDSGLVLRYLPDTVYDRGHSRTNPGEAEAVASAVMEHARAQLTAPEETRRTLGVAAFSLAQTSAILDALEELRLDDPDCEPFFAPDGPEPFFVKNLENVQGDERDVIFISIGYGRTASGDVPMNFGPLNGEGGERRLNVLITRARRRCEVFTNLKARDLDLDRTRSRGVRALKTFLDCAETGKLDGEANGRLVEPSSTPFDSALRTALTSAGLSARVSVGSEGVAPEVIVADPDSSGRDLMGVLSDGPAASRGRPARDRDRLRPQVLEALGWRLHRAWSVDWARDPDHARKRLLDAVAFARSATPAPPPAPVVAPAHVTRDDPGSAETAPNRATPYRMAAPVGVLDLATAATSVLVKRIVKVVESEGPIHREEAQRRVAEGAGAKRIGSRSQVALDEAVDGALAIGKVLARDAFLWPVDLQDCPVRDRSDLPANSRRPELIAPEEFAAAIARVVSDSLGMPADSISQAAARLLGFPRLTDDLRARIEDAIVRLRAARRLAEQGENLVLVEAG